MGGEVVVALELLQGGAGAARHTSRREQGGVTWTRWVPRKRGRLLGRRQLDRGGPVTAWTRLSIRAKSEGSTKHGPTPCSRPAARRFCGRETFIRIIKAPMWMV
jgi:hypothetical protein